MGDPYRFTNQTLIETRQRQEGACACCREQLDDSVEEGHHVIPRQLGAPDQRRDGFLETSDNCVIICKDCHDRVHEDAHFKDGAVAPPEYFPGSHGANTAAHEAWVGEVHSMEDNYYPQQDAGGGQGQA